MSYWLCFSVKELFFHVAGHDEHLAFLHQGIVIEDAASHMSDPFITPAGRTPTEEAVERAKTDLINQMWEHIKILERTLREVKARARESDQKNKDLQREIRTLKAEARRLAGPGEDRP